MKILGDGTSTGPDWRQGWAGAVIYIRGLDFAQEHWGAEEGHDSVCILGSSFLIQSGWKARDNPRETQQRPKLGMWQPDLVYHPQEQEAGVSAYQLLSGIGPASGRG